MKGIRLNRNLIKILMRHNENIDTYRLYIIARDKYSNRSGIFSLIELCDLLHNKYDYKSLHKRAGNKIKPFKNRLYGLFKKSILFREIADGRFIINSEKKILTKYKGFCKSTWYELPNYKILSSKKLFRDFCIGLILSGNKFRANKHVAEFFGCSVRRIQNATASNHKNEIFFKQYNFINDVSGTGKQIKMIRAELFNIHGISSPKPIRHKGEWVLRLNAPNSYKSLVLNGVKGYKVQATKRFFKKKECWFKPVRQTCKQLKLFSDNFKTWIFNENIYNLNKYLENNSKCLNFNG